MTATVLIVPVLLFSILLIVQFALAHHAQAVLTAAAQDAARAVQAEEGTAEMGQRVAKGFVSENASQLLHGLVISVAADADQVHVEVRGDVVSLVPGVVLEVTGSADGPRERFRPEAER